MRVPLICCDSRMGRSYHCLSCVLLCPASYRDLHINHSYVTLCTVITASHVRLPSNEEIPRHPFCVTRRPHWMRRPDSHLRGVEVKVQTAGDPSHTISPCAQGSKTFPNKYQILMSIYFCFIVKLNDLHNIMEKLLLL